MALIKKIKNRRESRHDEHHVSNESLPELIHRMNPKKSAREIEQEIEDALDRIENGTAVFYTADEFTELLRREGLI